MIYRILHELKYYIRGWFRRIFYQWFSPHKLVAIRSMKRSQYWDVDTMLIDAVFQIFRNFVDREMGGLSGIQASIDHLSKSLSNNQTYEEEKAIISSQLEMEKRVRGIYEWCLLRDHRMDPDDVYPEPSVLYLNDDGNPTNRMMAAEKTDSNTFRMNKCSPEYAEYLEKVTDLEEQYYKEDTEKAQEILSIRAFLWT